MFRFRGDIIPLYCMNIYLIEINSQDEKLIQSYILGGPFKPSYNQINVQQTHSATIKISLTLVQLV